MAALDILVAIFVPLRITYSRFASNPASFGEDGGYIVAALGAAGSTLVAFVLVPCAIALFILAWGTLTQKNWAWYGNAALIGFGVLSALVLFGTSPLAAVFRAVLAGIFGWYWFQPTVRGWYGAQGRPW